MKPILESLLNRFGTRKTTRPSRNDNKQENDSVSYKLVPVISQDYCTGCALCAQACEHQCLEMGWDYPKLQRPNDCHSDGACVNACPEECIRLDWVPTTGDQRAGCWRETLEPE